MRMLDLGKNRIFIRFGTFICMGVMIMWTGMTRESYGSQPTAKFIVENNQVLIRTDQGELPVSLMCPQFILEDQTVGGTVPQSIQGEISSGEVVECTYAPLVLAGGGRLEVVLHLQWSPSESVLRKWASFRLGDDDRQSAVIREIILEQTDYALGARQIQRHVPQSFPVFFPAFFAGIEFPVSTVRVENSSAILAHAPGIRMSPGVWYESRKAVYGVARKGDESRAFTDYIARHYPTDKKLHVDYNSWWSTGIPYSEPEILALMQTLKEELYDPYGVGFDTFCIDLGWSDPHSIWDISKEMFPEGFTHIQQSAKAMGTHLGVWVSPVSAYPAGLDNTWAKEQGYLTFPSMMGDQPYPLICVTDERYRSQLENRLVEMINRYGVRHFKFDNFRFECPADDHGHEPGELSTEALTESIISIFDAIHAAAPDAWIESSAFGAYQSPWWLFHIDSALGDIGDDYPYGIVPSPIYLESYTTARDFCNFQGILFNSSLPRDQCVLGITKQSPDPHINDAVIATMRGNLFLPNYVNPNYMTDAQWKALASILTWARTNESILWETSLLLPASMLDGTSTGRRQDGDVPREPYGYAHWEGNRGIIAFRNPWIAPQNYMIKLDKKIGIREDINDLSAVSLYPQIRVYDQNLSTGDMLDVPLAPYETVVLSISRDQSVDSLPKVNESILNHVRTQILSRQVYRAEFEESSVPMGPDWTHLISSQDTTLGITLEAQVDIDAPQAELLILHEDNQKVVDPVCTVWINGEKTPVSVSGSDTGWAAAGFPPSEHWLFLIADLPAGSNHVKVELLNRSETASIAAWVWAKKDAQTGETPNYPNALPQPEYLSLDAAQLLEPVTLDMVDLVSQPMERPIEKIDGIYLDALDPQRIASDVESLSLQLADESYALGAGQTHEQTTAAVQYNQNIGGQPLTVFGRHYLRGLGVQGPSRLAIALDGEFTKFQSWIGLDGALNVWDESTLTFQVWVDGEKRWESSQLKRNMPPQWVDVDISDTQIMELVVIKEASQLGRTIMPWANWLHARLLNK